MDNQFLCWKCGTSLTDMPLPLSRFAECRTCRSRLHACRMCEFFDPHVAKQCREPVADFVQDKERANFCGYFKPGANAYNPGEESRARAAQDNLNAMFGLATDTKDGDNAGSAEEQARKKLGELFRK